MIVVDAHSKWLDIVEMHSTSAKHTITELNKMFAAYWLLHQVVSENGPQFVSSEFQLFMQSDGIKHIRCSPYYPSFNSLAERIVQIFKKAMKASAHENTSISQTFFFYTSVKPMLQLMKCLVHYSWEGPSKHDWTYCFLPYRN